MNQKNIVLALIILANTPIASADYKAFVGIEWGLSGDLRPKLVSGLKMASVENTSWLSGLGTSITIGMEGKYNVKVYRISGMTHLQIEYGVGYNFRRSAPVTYLGVQSLYVNGGLSYIFDDNVDYNIGINTVGKYEQKDNGLFF